MTRRPLLALIAVALSVGAARSEIYECVEADGSTRFVSDLHACNRAKLHPLKARVERLSAPVTPSGDAVEHRAGAMGDASLGHTGPRLEQLLLASSDVGADWSVVGETPIDPIQDPDLVRWGVRAKRSRHYTRSSYAAVQVCSIEIWAFVDTQRARSAHENFRYPNWQIEREGPLLVRIDGHRYHVARHEGCVHHQVERKEREGGTAFPTAKKAVNRSKWFGFGFFILDSYPRNLFYRASLASTTCEFLTNDP